MHAILLIFIQIIWLIFTFILAIVNGHKIKEHRDKDFALQDFQNEKSLQTQNANRW